MQFKDRKEAADKLSDKLVGFKDNDNVVIVGIPRGGAILAYVISQNLNLDWGLVITRKLALPTSPEFSLGAIDPDGNTEWYEEYLADSKISKDEFSDIIKKQLAEIKRREKLYDKTIEKYQGKTFIIVDDGIATGLTLLSAVKYLRAKGGKQIIIASPVASSESLDLLESQVDKMVVLYIPDIFDGVARYYENFEQVSDEDVIKLTKGENL